jgi:hypothetical protein
MTKAIMSEDWTRITRERNLESEHEMKEWEKYDWCFLFKNMIKYLRQELDDIEDLSRQKKKVVIHQSTKYSLTSEKSLLMYHEKDDRRSSCLAKKQIESILENLHDEHEHYNHVIVLDRMKNEAY